MYENVGRDLEGFGNSFPSTKFRVCLTAYINASGGRPLSKIILSESYHRIIIITAVLLLVSAPVARPKPLVNGLVVYVNEINGRVRQRAGHIWR